MDIRVVSEDVLAPNQQLFIALRSKTKPSRATSEISCKSEVEQVSISLTFFVCFLLQGTLYRYKTSPDATRGE